MCELEAEPAAESAGAAKDPSPRLFPKWWAFAVCSLTFLAYARTLRFQFVHDDRGQILGNPAVHSWLAVPGYFTSQVWAAVAPGTFAGNDYRPVFLLWLRINDAIFGQWAVGWHLTTVLAHVVATYCVFLLAYRILGDRLTALFSGLIFGLHPVHIEGVAWVSGVPEPLLAALLIPAYLCWIRSREAGGSGGRWLTGSLILYTLAMLTKETAVVLTPVLFASQWLGFPCTQQAQTSGWLRRSLSALMAILPYLVLTALYLLVRMIALKGFSHPAAELSWLTMLLTWPSLLLFYLKLLIWPVGLSPFYGLQFILHPTFRNTVLPALVLLLVSGGLWIWASHSRPVALIVPWLVFPVLPVLDIQVFGNGNFAHNRYLYLPSVGFSILVALALKELKAGKQHWGAVHSSKIGLAVGLAAVMAFAINIENRYYANDATFYSYASSRMGNSDPVIGMDYANTLAEQGDFGHAAEIYRKVIQAQPEMWSAYFNLGYLEYQTGNLDLAVQYLSRAADGDPSNAGAVFYLGLADLKLNRIGDAEGNLRRAIVLAPSASNYHFALGMVLKVKGDWPGALAEFNRELALNPGHTAAAQQAAEIQRQEMK